MSLGQALLKRHPDTTRDQFSENWLRHATIVVPYFLHSGVPYYAQVSWPEKYPKRRKFESLILTHKGLDCSLEVLECDLT